MATKTRSTKQYPAVAVDPDGFSVWLVQRAAKDQYDPPLEDGDPAYLYMPAALLLCGHFEDDLTRSHQWCAEERSYASQVPPQDDPHWANWWDYGVVNDYLEEYWAYNSYGEYVGFDDECDCSSCRIDRVINSGDGFAVRRDDPIVRDGDIAKWRDSDRMHARDRVGRRRRNNRKHWSYKYHENNAMHHRDKGYWRLETAANRLRAFMVASYDGI